MTKTNKFYLIGCMLAATACSGPEAKAQDIHFSQFYENAILRNPALTGIFSGDYKAGVNYRTQWSNISAPFKTILASAETRVAVNREVGDYISFGATATYDRAGSINFNSMQIYPAINYNKAMADGHRSYLSIGFTGGYIQRSYDLSKATYSSQYANGQYDPLRPSGENMNNTSLQYFDLGAGMSFNSTIGEAHMVNYYIGAAAYHVAKPKETFAGDQDMLRLDTKWNGNLGIRAAFNEQYSLIVHVNYSQQGPYQEIIGGGLVSWHTRSESIYNFAVYAGCFLRVKDALIPTIKLDYDKYSITMSYDVNTSSLKPATNGTGGYEMSLYIRGNYKHNDRMGGQVACPRFEQMLDHSATDF
ncbi:MAG: PorP/SprF family type IX secretion system membrane protein [Bacteroidetes bacterium]|nr:PorP/SprF family type IX secretion system membrane protein [Bacteroidota bacterium]